MKKHFFLINPAAGKKDPTAGVLERIAALGPSLAVSHALTKAPGHAEDLTREALLSLGGEDTLAVYACGGDGTLFEALNGGFGDPRLSLASVPVGSGNDFIKSFPEYTAADFLDLPRLAAGKTVTIDSIAVGRYHSLNILSAGFDAAVCRYMKKYKHLPLVGGKGAYDLALADALIRSRKHYFRLVADGEEIEDGTHPHLFVIAANGRYYGGGFKASPLSSLDDGLLDVITIPTLSIPRFLRLVGYFKRGEHLSNPLLPFVRHSLRKVLRILSPEEVTLNLDGELVSLRDPEVRILPASVHVILPA